ncbi:MAG: TonB-dependent receptor [Runella slithyformis]|nr:MAG: TonB-dependent receptor [Runella slithyformis]TAE99054.1 MAG: TonB-dependent receptor [Runella slithyformis]TAF27149.1 MAG: TonB-dependent receptor [Runella slithyformis]TAF45588.1 MAG: TonB-dependent receptor [Runella slithyformis]TAF82668.1 MAG: TonB-dependent receptor [Runella slithyformis]
MRKQLRYVVVCTILFIGSLGAAMAQTQLSGKITDATTKEPLIGISLQIKGKVTGTITDLKGNFSLNTATPPPFSLIVTGIGYATQEIKVEGGRSNFEIAMKEQVILGQEVVVSASRVEESVLQSPVTIEKMDIRSMQNSPAPSFYDALRNVKGVEMSTQSLTFSNFNTRGFSGNGNVRVVQMVDGMDNQAPGLNFAVANIVGASELDVESVELIPGAASALYGPNAINGLLLTSTKSPFLYQGVSAYAKLGVMSAENRTQRYSNDAMGATPYYDVAFRYAKAFNNKFAFKLNAAFLTAQDWQATDYRDQSLLNGFGLEGTRATNRAYNGVNVYGDIDPGINMFQVLQSALTTPGSPLAPLNAGVNQLAGLLGPAAGLTQSQAYSRILTDLYAQPLGFNLSRTGYRERDLVDYTAKSMKFNASVHYRLNENVEAILQANWGTGTTVYTGADRYYIDKFTIGQYKAELKGDNFFVRAYTTQENSGDSYAVGIAGLGVNNSWRYVNNRIDISPTSNFFGNFAGTYAGASFPVFAQQLQGALGRGLAPLAAYQAALQATAAGASQYLGAANNAIGNNAPAFAPGTAEFERQLAAVIGRPIPGDANGVGARFLDRTSMYHAEAMYNFSKKIDPKTVELIVGGNYRVYNLNSSGTLFFSEAGRKAEPSISEYGFYAQAAKSIAEKLKLTGSVRYDKNQNFAGQFSPRISAVYSASRNHNIRTSYQTGFRIPTTQNQFIDLLTPQARLIGGLPEVRQFYGLQNGILALTPQGLRPFNFSEFKPERVRTFEIGYKGLISNKLLIDFYYYNSTYQDFIGSTTLIQNAGQATQQAYSMPTNYDQDIKSQGFGIGLDYSLPKNFTVSANVSNNTLNAGGVKMLSGEKNKNILEDGFQVGFNTPKYRYNVTFGNRNLGGSGWSFNVVWRHQDEFEWLSSLGSNSINITSDARNRPVIPAYGTLDAQISKKLSGLKSILKIGGSNLTGVQYTTGWGNPTVGSMYYVGLTFDELLNK